MSVYCEFKIVSMQAKFLASKKEKSQSKLYKNKTNEYNSDSIEKPILPIILNNNQKIANLFSIKALLTLKKCDCTYFK